MASARRAYEGITNAVTNSFLLGKIYELRNPSLAMAEIRRMYVPNDDLDNQAYLREYVNTAMVPGEKPETYFERMTIITEKLAEVGTPKSDHESNLHVLQCLSPESEVDITILQYAPNLTLSMIEDGVQATYGELQRKGRTIDGGTHVLVAAGGGSSFHTPGHHVDGATKGGVGKWGGGQWQQQQ